MPTVTKQGLPGTEFSARQIEGQINLASGSDPAGITMTWKFPGIALGRWNAKSWRNSSGGHPHWFYDGVKPAFDRRCMDCHKRDAYNGGTWDFGGGPMDQPMPVTSFIWQDRGLAAHMATERYGTLCE